ncbi:U-box domain-containing protein 44-like [Mercurialis annua]|uniref:U-box domain-containing protein 44-like n=1 Tax=Mercurialis annua TaxID=3986 RepID=UPI00215E3588|nr:U-box domain-containing protein 44-like [Mercurialis annua]
MQTCDSRSFSELVTQLQASAEEVASLAENSEFDKEILAEFAGLLDKFTPILTELKDNDKIMDGPPVRKAVESLENEFKRVKDLIKSSSSSTRSHSKQMEDLTQDLGRSLGLILFAGINVSSEFKEKVAVLHKELMNAKFNTSLSSSPSPCANLSSILSQESDFGSEFGFVGEIEEESITLSTEDVVLQIKYGNDEELMLAILGLRDFVMDQTVDKEWISDEGVIPILFNRLSSSKSNSRWRIVQILRIIASDNSEMKEQMVDVEFLKLLVRSLTREVDERREAVGLLLELSEVSAARRRIGRIQGCIVMLVTMLNDDDSIASHDAEKLLNELSSNTQNALHMAEAAYFKPLVHCLKQGSDMNKILMATAISRMELTDQRRASLGEDGAVEPLVKMFKAGKLESKLSALNALHNLSNLTENIQRLISSGIVVPLLQLLFSVTSVLMTLREPASAILARIAQSESFLVNHDVAQQMLSLLNLCCPVIQCHLLEALNNIASQSRATKVRKKMKENGAVQLLVPFLTENNVKNRTATLKLIYTLSKDSPEELMEQLGDSYLIKIVNIVASSTSESEKAVAIGILSNLPISNKKASDILNKCHLLPVLISIMSSSTQDSTETTSWLMERIADMFVRFTVPSDKKLQLHSAELGVIPLLVKLLSTGSLGAKYRAAISLAQLSQNSLALRKSRNSRWMCMPSSGDSLCEVHDGYCIVKTTFCLAKAGAVTPLIKLLKGDEREADEAVLGALSTLLQDEIWENGCNYLAKMSILKGLIKVLESGNVKAQEKALWILERMFRIEEHKTKYGGLAQAVLIDLAQTGDPRLKSAVGKVLAQLELLQDQSSYF